MSCPREHDSAAYILGALSPDERRGFEQHLADCPRCAESVRRLAGMPGLLSLVDPADVAAADAETPPVPETLLPRLLVEVRARKHRRAALLVGATAAGFAAVAAIAVGVGTRLGPEEPDAVTSPRPSHTISTVTPAEQPMATVVPTRLQAWVAVSDTAWGSQVTLTCRYPSTGSWHGGAPPTYVLTVRTDVGDTQRVAAWRALPGRTITVTGASSWSPAAIRSVQVRTTSGRTVLTLDT